MTVQEIGDEFTLLSHQGQAQAKVMHVSGGEVKNVTGIEMIGDDIALIKSETIRNQDAESAKIINEKLKIDVWKFVEKKNPDYKKDVIKHQTLVSLLIEFASKREEVLKADFDYFIEGKDVEIMELKEDLRNKKIAIQNKKAEIKLLGDRCNQLLKDKGYLTDRIDDIKANCDLAIEGRDVKIKELELELTVQKDLLQEETNLHLHAEEYTKRLEEGNNKLLDVINNQDVKIADLEEKLKTSLDYNKSLLNALKNCGASRLNSGLIERAENYIKEN